MKKKKIIFEFCIFCFLFLFYAALQFVKHKLPDLLRSYIDSGECYYLFTLTTPKSIKIHPLLLLDFGGFSTAHVWSS